jgi:hypothetical protein
MSASCNARGQAAPTGTFATKSPQEGRTSLVPIQSSAIIAVAEQSVRTQILFVTENAAAGRGIASGPPARAITAIIDNVQAKRFHLALRKCDRSERWNSSIQSGGVGRGRAVVAASPRWPTWRGVPDLLPPPEVDDHRLKDWQRGHKLRPDSSRRSFIRIIFWLHPVVFSSPLRWLLLARVEPPLRLPQAQR